MLAGTLKGVDLPAPRADRRRRPRRGLRGPAHDRPRARHDHGPRRRPGRLTEVIAEGGYYGMQTFDQALFDHLKAGRVTIERGDAGRHQPARLQAARRRRRPPRHDDGRPRRQRDAPGRRRRVALERGGVGSAPPWSTGTCARPTSRRTSPRCCTPRAASRGRSVIHLPAGERLQDHEVHERATCVVRRRRGRGRRAGGLERGRPGLFLVFDPGERHEVRATTRRAAAARARAVARGRALRAPALILPHFTW